MDDTKPPQIHGMDKPTEAASVVKPEAKQLPTEIGGQKGPEPTRYGDWEKNGRCTDF